MRKISKVIWKWIWLNSYAICRNWRLISQLSESRDCLGYRRPPPQHCHRVSRAILLQTERRDRSTTNLIQQTYEEPRNHQILPEQPTAIAISRAEPAPPTLTSPERVTLCHPPQRPHHDALSTTTPKATSTPHLYPIPIMHDCLTSGGHFFLLTPSIRSFTCQRCRQRPNTPPYRCLLEVCAHTVCEPCATLLHKELWDLKLRKDADASFDIKEAAKRIASVQRRAPAPGRHATRSSAAAAAAGGAIEADDDDMMDEDTAVEYRSARLAAARGRERRKVTQTGAAGAGASLAGMRAVRS